MNRLVDIPINDEEFFDNSPHKLIVLRRKKLIEKKINNILGTKNLNPILTYSLESFANLIVELVRQEIEREFICNTDNIFRVVQVSDLLKVYIKKKYKDKIEFSLFPYKNQLITKKLL